MNTPDSGKDTNTGNALHSAKSLRIIAGFSSALIPALLFAVMCIYLHITPFGDRTFMYEDMKLQYVDFFLYFKNVLTGHDTMLYSVNCGLGADMVGFWTYYLLSPFNLLFLMVPDMLMPAAVTIVLLLKVSSIGFTTWLLLDYISDRKLVLWCTLLSTCFAFGTWVVANMTNPMWLDPVIILPVALIFLMKMMRDDCDSEVHSTKRPAIGYVIAVTVMIITNYYIAAMNLLFLSVFMVLLAILRLIDVRKFGRYVIATGISCVLDLWLLIPTYISLLDSEKSHSPYILDVMETFLPSSAAKPKLLNPLALIPKLFSMSYDSLQIMDGQPDIYVGLLPLILALCFFMNKKIDARRKACAGIFLVTLICFFCIKELNLIAHFGTEPYGYLYRYAYVWAFACVILGLLCLMNADGVNMPSVIVSALICLTLLGVAVLRRTQLLNPKSIVLNAGTIVIEAAAVWAYAASRRSGEGADTPTAGPVIVKKLIILLCPAILMLELGMNYKAVYNNHAYFASYASEYAIESTQIAHDLQVIREYEASHPGIPIQTSSDAPSGSETVADNASTTPYRIESFPHRNANDSMSFAYRSASAYNSLLPMEHRILLYKLGYNDNGLFTDYDPGNTRCMDAMLGIRYMMTDGNYEPSVGQTKITDTIIRNDHALSADAVTGDNVPELLDLIEAKEDDKDDRDPTPFDKQEMLWNTLTGRDDEVFVSADFTSETTPAGGDDEPVSYTYNVTAACDGCMYFYMNRDDLNQRNLELDKNGEMITYYGNASCQKIVSLGYMKAGEQVRVTIRCVDDIPELPAEPVFVTEDVSVLAAADDAG